MPFELHADYDRDGRLTASATEYAKRSTGDGAWIFPNVDHDGRALPAKVEEAEPVKPDFLRPTTVAQDREPVPIRVLVTPPDQAENCTLFLRAEGALGSQLRVRDEKLRLIPINPEGRKTDFILPMPNARGDFFVETATVAGSPRGDAAADPRRLVLELFCDRGGGDVTLVDSGRFQVPPLLVLDDLAPAERLYVAEAELELNVPSLRDVARELQGTGVPVLVIPEAQTYKDVWVQDQFQVAHCAAGGKSLRMIVHCPRARANLHWVEKSLNLAMTVQGHFRSTDLGLIDDLLERHISVPTLPGVRESMTLMESQNAYLEMTTVFSNWRRLVATLSTLASLLEKPDWVRARLAELTAEKASFVTIRAQMALVLELFELTVDSLTSQASPPPSDQLSAYLARARDWKAAADKAVPAVTPHLVSLPMDAKRRVTVAASEADKLFDRLSTVHDSLSFGGNIECSPPMKDAPHGKVVIGTNPSGGDGAIDPDVLNFFLSQDAQPIVEVDSAWLHVGHVDEFMGFVSAPKAGDHGFVIARANPKLGNDIIEAACQLYLSGLPMQHPHLNLGDLLDFGRITHWGDHPVTMMLRGKQWLHLHSKEAAEAMEPPTYFKDLSLAVAFTGPMEPDWEEKHDRFVPGPLPETWWHAAGKRRYAARMSVLEWRHIEDGSNPAIEADVLAPIVAGLEEHFVGVPILSLPVLFDRVPSGPETDAQGVPVRNYARSVKSFLPDAANFQTVGDRILVPRPYGPRMKPADAALVLAQAFSANKLKLPKLDDRYFKRRGLLNSVVWASARDDWRLAGAVNVEMNLWKIFRDGFRPHTGHEAIFKKIRAANPGAFDSSEDLRDGWQRLTIPDETVDLFEAAIVIQLEAVGATPRFVDSWHYHTHGGEIHCGTNVLRRPRKAK